MRILLVEDDLKILDYLFRGLSESGYVVDKVSNGSMALDFLATNEYDLLVLDIMLPGIDGFEVLKKLRRNKQSIPVIILSAKQNVKDRVKGLEVGADDYLTKPFSFSELLARVQALLRRSYMKDASEATFIEKGQVKIDLISRKVYRNGRELIIQGKEYILLEFFLRNSNRVLTKTQILEAVWDYQFNPQTNVVDVLVFRLRTKLDLGQDKEKLIKTIRGVGYIFEAN